MMYEQIEREQLELREVSSGYEILVDGQHAGVIEGQPGWLGYIDLELRWEGRGVARAAIREFVDRSLEAGVSEVRARNPTHSAAAHLLETEGFERQHGGDWVYRPDDGDSG